MPRSNSSLGVAEGGNVVSAALAPGPRAARRRRGCGGRRQGAAGIARATEIERLARPAPAGRADRRFVGDRQLATAERARRAGRIRVLAGIEGVAAAAPAGRGAAGSCTMGAGRCDLRLLVVSRLGLRIALLGCG